MNCANYTNLKLLVVPEDVLVSARLTLYCRYKRKKDHQHQHNLLKANLLVSPASSTIQFITVKQSYVI